MYSLLANLMSHLVLSPFLPKKNTFKTWTLVGSPTSKINVKFASAIPGGSSRSQRKTQLNSRLNSSPTVKLQNWQCDSWIPKWAYRRVNRSSKYIIVGDPWYVCGLCDVTEDACHVTRLFKARLCLFARSPPRGPTSRISSLIRVKGRTEIHFVYMLTSRAWTRRILATAPRPPICLPYTYTDAVPTLPPVAARKFC